MSSSELSPEDRTLVDSLMFSWQELLDRGEQPRPKTICPDRPDLWEAIGARAVQLQAMAYLDGQDEKGPVSGDLLAGQYRLLDVVASGGHAVVWRAIDENFNRQVAVKLISIGSLANPKQLTEEATKLASLTHGHIVRVLSNGIEGQVAFMVQEFVNGDTLRKRIEVGPLSEKQIIEWISQVAEALQAAHDAQPGVIHRDVKPENILIDGYGKALLADFGISMPMANATCGTSTGTIPYKSPEQFRNRPLDRRSDVFSLGLVLFEALTGRLPYSELDAETIGREMQEPLAKRIVRLPTTRRLLPRFMPLLERTLAVHPDARPRDALAFRDELERAFTRKGNAGRIVRWAIVVSLAAIAFTLVMIVVTAVTEERLHRSHRERNSRNWQLMEEGQRRVDVRSQQNVEAAQRALGEVMDAFKEAQGKVRDVRQLNQDILEQTRRQDP